MHVLTPEGTMRPEWAREKMVNRLIAQGIVRTPGVEAALLGVPRHHFVPRRYALRAYDDAPAPLAGGQTISAPHMVAMMAEALDVRPGHRLLEIGCGSGYHAAVYARLVSPGGSVVTVEVLPELVALARANLARLRNPQPITIIQGDGSLSGFPGAPFDRISVAAGAPHLPPSLVDALAPDGVLVIPIGPPGAQDLMRYHEQPDGTLEARACGPARFVPLVGPDGYAAEAIL